MPRIHSLEHVSFEGLGNIGKWAWQKNFSVSRTLFYEKPVFPRLEDFDWLIVMGGPMSVYEEEKYPWLAEEKKFIEKAIRNKKIVLGICLGSQLIAEVLGAKVYPNKEKEIGWFPVRMNPEIFQFSLFQGFPKEINVFHWHGDTYDLPADALRIASSEGCLNQGFIYDQRVIGLQFHLEVSLKEVQIFIEKGKNEFRQAQYIQLPEQILSLRNYYEEIEHKLFKMLNVLAKK